VSANNRLDSQARSEAVTDNRAVKINQALLSAKGFATITIDEIETIKENRFLAAPSTVSSSSSRNEVSFGTIIGEGR